jgi:DNA-binding NarL/FixJ family response regulator
MSGKAPGTQERAPGETVPTDRPIRILLYTQHAFVAEGLATVLTRHRGFEFAGAHDQFNAVLASLRRARPDILLVYPVSRPDLSELRGLLAACDRCHIVLWGRDTAGDAAVQAMRLGVRAILPATTPVATFLATLRNVHSGVLCFDRSVWESAARKRPDLTPHQEETIQLVALGYTNDEIADIHGITEGTVAARLRELYRKLNIGDRLGLALYGRKNFITGPAPASVRTPSTAPRNAAPHNLIVIPGGQSTAPAIS